MTSEQIQIFIAVCRCLNFTKVAEEFHTTQPTVSRQINSLEEEWGFLLFLRNKKEVRLTAEGVVMYERCMEIEKRFADSILDAKNLAIGKSGQINLGFLDDFDEDQMIMPYMENFAMKYPNIRIKVENRSFAELRRKLEIGEFDLIFTLDFEKSSLKNALTEECKKLDPVFIISDRHPLYKKENLTVTDFNQITFVITSPQDSPEREKELREIFRILGIDNEIIAAPNIDSALIDVRLGKAATIQGIQSKSPNSERFRYVRIPEEAASLFMITAWNKENLNPAIPLFLEFVYMKNTQ